MKIYALIYALTRYFNRVRLNKNCIALKKNKLPKLFIGFPRNFSGKCTDVIY